MGALGLYLAPASALGPGKWESLEQTREATNCPVGAGSFHKYLGQLEKRKKVFAGSCGVGVEREAVGSSCHSWFG